MSNNQRSVVVCDGGTALVRINLAGDHTYANAEPPKCGSCPKLVGGKCRSGDGVQPKRSASDVGCSGHPSWQLYEVAAGAINQAAMGQVNAAARVLEQIAAATPAQAAWLDAREAGDDQPPVVIIGQATGDTSQATATDRIAAYNGIMFTTPAPVAAAMFRSHWL